MFDAQTLLKTNASVTNGVLVPEARYKMDERGRVFAVALC
jgi:hypothetical protein